MSSSTPSLTEYLLEIDKKGFKSATEAEFLVRAGEGTLGKEVLEQWLAQDRLYAQAYIRFASLLLANVRLPTRVDAGDIAERILDLVLEAIVNIRRELKFFDDVSSRYDLQLQAESVSEGVRQYRTLFHEVGQGIETGKLDVVDGLVLLWGTEMVYLSAWRYAASFLILKETEDADGGALRKEFIPNWASDHFAGFVQRIARLVDEVWVAEGGERKAEVEGRVRGLWERVLRVERVFWPVVRDVDVVVE